MRSSGFWTLLSAEATADQDRAADMPALRNVAAVSAALVIVMAFVAMMGWVLDIEALKSVLPGIRTMKANTAIAFACCGGSLALQVLGTSILHRRIAWGLALGGGAIGGLTLFEYVASVDLGIDQLLFAATDEAGRTLPGRMAPPTAFTLLMFGLVLALPERLSRAGKIVFLTLTHVALVAPALAALGYILGVVELYTPGPYTSMALMSAIAFLAVFVGLAALRADMGWVALLRAPGSGGSTARWLVPVIVLLPVTVAWLRVQGQEAGFYDWRTGTAILTSVLTVALIGLVGFSARRIEGMDRRRLRQERVHQSVLDTSFDAFILMDARGRVREWNPQAARMFGWTAEDAIGRMVAELIVPPALREAHAAGLARFLATGKSRILQQRLEMSAVRRDGSAFPCELVITAMPGDPGAMFSGFVRDVSEQRRTEEQLRQAQKMEAVGQLTGGVAHDFNNLLTVIIGSLEVALDRIEGPLRPAIENALKASERGAALVQQLLAVSRRQTLAPDGFDANALVSEMVELLQRAIGEHVEIEMHLAPDVAIAFADKNQLQNALLNLAVNARDAMPKGGKLTIETANATLDAAYAAKDADVTPGDYVMIALSDTGSGMSAEVLARALEPFYTTKEVGKGTGLGLSMVYGFAKQSRGHLRIYSEVGQGTTVRLYLPRAERETPGAAADTGHGEDVGGRETILVVEDDGAVRSFVIAQLNLLGYTVIDAANGLEALRLIEGGTPFDLLFTDVVMPGGLTGRELADHAQRARPSVRVLFTSGYTRNSIVHNGRLDPDVHFLAKPYRRHELAKKVREALDAPPGALKAVAAAD